MNRWHFTRPIVLLVALLSCPGFASAGAYTVNAGGERLEFVPQAEKGYVIKLAEKTGGIQALAGISALDAENARPVGGLDRRGVWTVENQGPASRNEDAIRSLRAGGQVAYAAPLFSSGGETVAIIPEIVVRVKPGTEIEQLQRLCKGAGCTIKKRMEFTEQEYLLEVLGPDAEAVFAAVEQLSQAVFVEWAAPNTAFRPKLSGRATPGGTVVDQRVQVASPGQDANTPGVFPNDEYFPLQWHLHNTGQSGGTPGADIRAPEAWEITTGDPNIVVALIDCGVDTKHPDLINNLVPGHDFYDNDDQPDAVLDHPLNTHGTNCAGLIVAQGNNGIGVAGVTWNCRIMPVRVWGSRADGTWYEITSADAATALRWAAAHGADIFSDSWCPYSSDQPILHSAIVDVTTVGGLGRDGKGCIYLSAAGNDAGPLRWYPTNYPEVIAVGASDHKDVRCSYSDYGPQLDIVAPSGWQSPFSLADFVTSKGRGSLWTTDISGPIGWNWWDTDLVPKILDYTGFAGTSGSCPIAAGVAALIFSVEPNLTGAEVRHFLERSAKDLGDPGRDDYYGWGRVDARAALDMVLAKRADLNNDWKVDEADRAILMKATETNDRSADIAPAAKRDGVVDAKDLELLTRYMGTVIPEMGLIAHWKLDETAGTTAYDSVGKNNAAVIGNAGWQPEGGKVGGALQLSGVANFAMTKFVYDPSQGPFSVFAWVKGGAPGQVVLSQAGGANWLMAAALDGTLATEVKESGRNGKPLTSQTVMTDGNWHRVVLSWDGSNRILYVDGVEVAKDAQANLAGSTGNLSIGAGSTMTPNGFWKGLIDDVRIYDRVVKP
jgi:subtilisin family serine protease